MGRSSSQRKREITLYNRGHTVLERAFSENDLLEIGEVYGLERDAQNDLERQKNSLKN